MFVRVPKLIAPAFLAWVAVRAADQPPKPTGLTETVEKRLVQLDVGVDRARAAPRGVRRSCVVGRRLAPRAAHSARR
jgi:hypothetical protein